MMRNLQYCVPISTMHGDENILMVMRTNFYSDFYRGCIFNVFNLPIIFKEISTQEHFFLDEYQIIIQNRAKFIHRPNRVLFLKKIFVTFFFILLGCKTLNLKSTSFPGRGP